MADEKAAQALKVVISDPKTGRSVQKDVPNEGAQALFGLKIGDKVKGEVLDLTGYEFEITGGSDFAGFPMRRDVPGVVRKKILAVSGVGVKNKKKYRKKKKKGLRTMKGMRQRVSVAGNTIYAKTAQVNMKILKAGSADIFPPKEVKEGKAVKDKGKPVN